MGVTASRKSNEARDLVDPLIEAANRLDEQPPPERAMARHLQPAGLGEERCDRLEDGVEDPGDDTLPEVGIDALALRLPIDGGELNTEPREVGIETAEPVAFGILQQADLDLRRAVLGLHLLDRPGERAGRGAFRLPGPMRQENLKGRQIGAVGGQQPVAFELADFHDHERTVSAQHRPADRVDDRTCGREVRSDQVARVGGRNLKGGALGLAVRRVHAEERQRPVDVDAPAPGQVAANGLVVLQAGEQQLRRGRSRRRASLLGLARSSRPPQDVLEQRND